MKRLDTYELIAAVQHLLKKPLHHATAEEIDTLSVLHFREIGVDVGGRVLGALRKRHREQMADGTYQKLFGLERELKKRWDQIDPEELAYGRVPYLTKKELGVLRARRFYEASWEPPKAGRPKPLRW